MNLFDSNVILEFIATGGGIAGLAALWKTIADSRNRKKITDISALEKTIVQIQSAYKELQDRYQEAMKDDDKSRDKLSLRLSSLEKKYIEQLKNANKQDTRILHSESTIIQLETNVSHLELKLMEANKEIKQLKKEIHYRELKIVELKQENVQLKEEGKYKDD